MRFKLRTVPWEGGEEDFDYSRDGSGGEERAGSRDLTLLCIKGVPKGGYKYSNSYIRGGHLILFASSLAATLYLGV